MAGKTRVIVVDDSQLMRDLIAQIVNSNEDMEVVATAQDAFEARERIKAFSPDVVLLDVEMPRMDGLTFLERIMRLRPMPVIMVSTLTVRGGMITLRALDLGAVDFVTKPSGRGDSSAAERFALDIAAKVRIAAASAGAIARRGVYAASVSPVHAESPGAAARNVVVAIGASTGGIEAITALLGALPAMMPPILIVQHLPQPFTKLFAGRLNALCRLGVKEAEVGDVLHPGQVYIAPGDQHMRLGRRASEYMLQLSRDPPYNGHRPAIDHLFNSVAQIAGRNAIGVILSGMGADGASGLLHMRRTGALTLGQDEATCVVYGMPRAAAELGAVMRQAPLEQLAREVVSSLHKLDHSPLR